MADYSNNTALRILTAATVISGVSGFAGTSHDAFKSNSPSGFQRNDSAGQTPYIHHGNAVNLGVVVNIDSKQRGISERADFDGYLQQYLQDAQVVSSVQSLMVLPIYGKIIGFGEQALPWLFDEIEQNPIALLPIVSAVSRAEPVQDTSRGKIELVVADWMTWARKQGFAS